MVRIIVSWYLYCVCVTAWTYGSGTEVVTAYVEAQHLGCITLGLLQLLVETIS